MGSWATHLLEQDIADISEGERVTSQETHKEETTARIRSDAKDGESIHIKLELCIDPLNPSFHPSNIVNIVSGNVADDAVNAQDTVSIGTEALKEHERQWPEGFRNTISKKVKTVADGKKFVCVGTEKVHDMTVIYSRVIGIQASLTELDLKKVLRHELAPVPTSMFHDSAAAKMCKAKSDLKKRLARETSSRIFETNQAAIVLDGSAIPWVVHWPAKLTVVYFVNNFKKYISNKLHKSDVYLVFDRYRDYSTKSVTREGRAPDASRLYELSENMPHPSQKAVLTVSANKNQLIDAICGNLASDVAFHTQHMSIHKLVVTASDNTPTEIRKGAVYLRQDMATSHEEEDNIKAQQAIMCAKQQPGAVSVIADDTDIFLLLLHHYQNKGLTSAMFMTSPVQQRSTIDIKATVEKHHAIVPGLLAAHALSGCDTVPTYF